MLLFLLKKPGHKLGLFPGPVLARLLMGEAAFAVFLSVRDPVPLAFAVGRPRWEKREQWDKCVIRLQERTRYSTFSAALTGKDRTFCYLAGMWRDSEYKKPKRAKKIPNPQKNKRRTRC